MDVRHSLGFFQEIWSKPQNLFYIHMHGQISFLYFGTFQSDNPKRNFCLCSNDHDRFPEFEVCGFNKSTEI